jgi:LuxR family glucitol operon transcriptional activator
LQRQRQAEGRPETGDAPLTKQQLKTGIAADFSHDNPRLEAWSALCHRYCLSVHLSLEELARAAAITPRHFSRRLQTGLSLLADHIRREEMAAHGRYRAQRLRRHLPPPDYAQLFGGGPLLRQLTSLLQQEKGPRMISIEGLGGIGKTALARALAGRLAEIGNLEGIAWISARHEWLTDGGELQPVADPARSLADIAARLAGQLGQTELAGLPAAEKLARLQPVLAAAPHLIIIDNLETAEDLTALIPALARLQESARFLLTSRRTLSRYPYVHRLPVPPLALADSRALVESELARRGRDMLLDAAAMRRLYRIVGGVPLALKLTAAQLAHLPLADVMDSLRRASRQPGKRLFTYIYRRAWQLLDDPAKALLLSCLSISPEGDGAAWLKLMSDLPADEFAAALAQLTDYSLLETAGPLDAPVYRLHRLTATFLQTEILLDWSA